MGVEPEDDSRRERDPRTSRNAAVLGSVVGLCLVAAAVVLLLSQRQPTTAVVTPTPAPNVSFGPTPTARVADLTHPMPGAGFAAVEDPAAHQLVIFGGVDSYDQTWLWDGRRWSLGPVVSPPGRFGAAMAYDPDTQLVMVYGGRLGPGQVADDTWAWDGKAWRQLDDGTGAPPPGEGSLIAWDPTVGEMMLVHSSGGSGGQTWFWKGNQWTRQLDGDLPSGGVVAGLAADPVTGRVLAATVNCCGIGQTIQGTLTWTGAGWQRVPTHATPAPAFGLALDPVSQKLMLCSEAASQSPDGPMSLWTGTDWAPLPGSQLPPIPLVLHITPGAEVTDTAAGHVLVLAYYVQPSQGAPQPIHIWSWGGAGWTQLW